MHTFRALLFIALLAGVSVLLSQKIYENIQPLADAPLAPVTVHDVSAEIPDPPRQQLAPPALDQFVATFERPLFRENRRPPEVEPAMPAEVVDRSLSATLQGILFSTSERVALLTPIGRSETVRVAEGGEYLGWRLIEIRPDSAVFQLGDDTVTLELIYKGTQGSGEPAVRQDRR